MLTTRIVEFPTYVPTPVQYDMLEMDLRLQQRLDEIDNEGGEDGLAVDVEGGEEEDLELDEDQLREIEAEMEVGGWR